MCLKLEVLIDHDSSPFQKGVDTRLRFFQGSSGGGRIVKQVILKESPTKGYSLMANNKVDLYVDQL